MERFGLSLGQPLPCWGGISRGIWRITALANQTQWAADAVTFATRSRDFWRPSSTQAGLTVRFGWSIANFLRHGTSHRLVRHYRQLQAKFELLLPGWRFEDPFYGFTSTLVSKIRRKSVSSSHSPRPAITSARATNRSCTATWGEVDITMSPCCSATTVPFLPWHALQRPDRYSESSISHGSVWDERTRSDGQDFL